MVHFRHAQNRIGGLFLIAFAAISFSVSAHASKKTKAPDVYPAIEDETDPAPQAKAAKPKLSNLAGKSAKSAPQNPQKADKTLFDQVPPEQIDGIARRLKLVDALLRRYGRAYDYRTHTVKELENILAQLEGPASGGAEPSLPAPPAETPQAPNSGSGSSNI